jgi:hypothetical protein
MLYDYLSQVKFVVDAKLEGDTFEEKYIARFWQKLHVSAFCLTCFKEGNSHPIP